MCRNPVSFVPIGFFSNLPKAIIDLAIVIKLYFNYLQIPQIICQRQFSWLSWINFNYNKIVPIIFLYNYWSWFFNVSKFVNIIKSISYEKAREYPGELRDNSYQSYALITIPSDFKKTGYPRELPHVVLNFLMWSYILITIPSDFIGLS